MAHAANVPKRQRDLPDTLARRSDASPLSTLNKSRGEMSRWHATTSGYGDGTLCPSLTTRHRAGSRKAASGGSPLQDIQRARYQPVAASSRRSWRSGGGPVTPRALQGTKTSATIRGTSPPKYVATAAGTDAQAVESVRQSWRLMAGVPSLGNTFGGMT